MNFLVQINEHDHVDFYKLTYDEVKHMLTLKDSGERWKYFLQVAQKDPNMNYWGFPQEKPDLYWNISWEWTDVDLEDWKKVLSKVVKL